MTKRIDDLMGSQPLLSALDSVAALTRSGWVVVPRHPDQEMLAAGAAACGMSNEGLLRAWEAMLRAC